MSLEPLFVTCKIKIIVHTLWGRQDEVVQFIYTIRYISEQKMSPPLLHLLLPQVLASRLTALDTWTLAISIYSAWVSFYLPETAGIPTYFIFMAKHKRARTISTMTELSSNNVKWPKSAWLAFWKCHGFMVSGLMVVPCGRDWPVVHQPFSLFLSARLYSPVSLRVWWSWDWVLANRTRVEMMGMWNVGEKPGP